MGRQTVMTVAKEIKSKHAIRERPCRAKGIMNSKIKGNKPPCLMLRTKLHFEYADQNNRGDNLLDFKHKKKREGNPETLCVKEIFKMYHVYARQEISQT